MANSFVEKRIHRFADVTSMYVTTSSETSKLGRNQRRRAPTHAHTHTLALALALAHTHTHAYERENNGTEAGSVGA